MGNAYQRWVSITFVIVLFLTLDSCGHIPPPPPAPVPIACDSAARMLSANVMTSQIDTLRSQPFKARISQSTIIASLDSIFARVGVQEFHDFLVRDIIQRILPVGMNLIRCCFRAFNGQSLIFSDNDNVNSGRRV